MEHQSVADPRRRRDAPRRGPGEPLGDEFFKSRVEQTPSRRSPLPIAHSRRFRNSLIRFIEHMLNV